ncbi:MAG: hypothetical protein Q7S15_00400 [bacterium]|nr:hypothetical protein [bacterium]
MRSRKSEIERWALGLLNQIVRKSVLDHDALPGSVVKKVKEAVRILRKLNDTDEYRDRTRTKSARKERIFFLKNNPSPHEGLYVFGLLLLFEQVHGVLPVSFGVEIQIMMEIFGFHRRA